MERLYARWQRLRVEQKIQLVVCGMCVLISGGAGWLVAYATLVSLAVPGEFRYPRPTATATPAQAALVVDVMIPTLEVDEAQQAAEGRKPAPARRREGRGTVLDFFGVAPGPTVVAEDAPPAEAAAEDRAPPAPRATDPAPGQASAPPTPDPKSTPVGTAPPPPAQPSIDPNPTPGCRFEPTAWPLRQLSGAWAWARARTNGHQC